jgi:hypothetical protein
MMRVGLIAVLLLASTAIPYSSQQLPSEPLSQFGQSVTGAFEGWFQNADGSYTFLVGYLNRNFAQSVEIPIGPNNHIDPGGPDLGQPTFFLPGRQYGMFTVRVPKEFSAQQRLTWTLTVNGQTTSIPLRLHPDYVVQPFSDVAVKNTPPIIRFEEKGASIQGPIAILSSPARTVTARVGTALPIALWAEDDAKYSSGNNAPQRNPPPPVVLKWSKYRGSGVVKFDKDNPAFEKLPGGSASFSGKATVNATFGEPGDYLLHVTANDYSGEGGGGEVCCWTTALVRVSVK